MGNYIMFWLAKAIAPVIIVLLIWIIDIIIITIANKR